MIVTIKAANAIAPELSSSDNLLSTTPPESSLSS
jgi:hypothetical protein